MTTSVPPITWGTNGPQVPSGPAILTGVQADITAAFASILQGAALNFNLNTPQGQLSSSWAGAISNFYQIIAFYASQMDPAYSMGRMQDGIGRIYQVTRNPAESTVIEVTCGGAQGTPLPAGPLDYATVIDQSENIYQCTGAGTIPASGSITLSFACTTPGPVPVPTSIEIYQAISGWDTVALVSGTEGQNAESSQQFEQRREASVEGNSISQNGSMQGALLGVPGVLDAYVVSNDTNTPATIGGVSIPANTQYVAVSGGAAAQVAQTIWQKKPPGIPLYTGNNNQVVTDPNPAYSPPAPTYTITWETPAALQVYFAVVIAAGALVPSTGFAAIQQAIVQAFQGGVTIFTGSITGTTLTVSAIEQGALQVGQIVTGPGVAQSTTISALGTGSGGIGTYQLSISQTVASTSMVAQPATNTPVPPRARIGSTIFASQYGALIGTLGSWAQVTSILVGSNNIPSCQCVGSVSGNVLTVTAVTSGTLAVNQFVSGSDSVSALPAGTIITALDTGTGGTGTYFLSNSLTLAGATFTGTAGSGSSANQITASSVTGVIGIGDVIAGTGIPAGTTITAQLSGTAGGAGVYQTSVNTTASSAAVTCGAAITTATANQGDVSVNINQAPQIGLSNVLVTQA